MPEAVDQRQRYDIANAFGRDLDREFKSSNDGIAVPFICHTLPKVLADGGHFLRFLHAPTENKGLTFSDSGLP